MKIRSFVYLTIIFGIAFETLFAKYLLVELDQEDGVGKIITSNKTSCVRNIKMSNDIQIRHI